ncbi:phosphoribosylglycinamide formyltransferase [Muribacter muris]|uniref:Phosphoribosylglycinamide formyltransferase n=1 Tax=Muribacter muris TaxID=67855 RepID=A0A4Y9K9Y8_9PAST|nr:phosphoribosylglycinamide formyltransferase [Muribacter muris]MBF0784013.1 phosphoribosylglycinamide formyltransferase [Muribacter muris]MBF0827438.1 phosphoribosylglycinamide formyltransferase [Muribacter muris]TFV13406.1 phosphoribosylglycinamide formyltransferase [Muribacter muris]
MKNIVVMISGSGTNLQKIIEAQQAGNINGRICAVISNKADAYGLVRAEQVGIPTFVFERKAFDSNQAMDSAIAEQLIRLDADLIVLAGYMKILTAEFTCRFAGKIINIHPSLLPKYAGLHTHERAMAAGDREHGMSIHFVNEEVDGGAIILQAKVPIYPDDVLDEVIQRVYEQEHRCYPLVVQWFCADRLYLENGKAYLDNQPLGPQGYAIE